MKADVDEFRAAKSKAREHLLGRVGVHGIGTDPERGELRIYADKRCVELDEEIAKLNAELPDHYALRLIVSEPPTIAGSSDS